MTENVTLRVKARGAEPRVYARWRGPQGENIEKALGRGWLVRPDDREAKPRGEELNGWVERRGRAPEGYVTPRSARERVPALVAKYAAEAERERRRARRLAKASREKTVQEAADAWVAWRSVDDPEGAHQAWKATTKANNTDYANRLARELGKDRPVDSVTPEELRKLLAEGLKPMRNGAVIPGRETSRKMRSYYAATARGIFAHACARGWVDEDPAVALPAYRARRKRADDPLRRHEYLTPDELRSVVLELERGKKDEERRDPRGAEAARRQDAAIVLTMGMAGLRPAEALALTWDCVDLVASAVRIVESHTALGGTDTPKSHAGRTVPLPEELARELAKVGLRDYMTGGADLVFVGPQGGHVELSELRDRFNAAQDRAKVSPRRELRQLRNTFGTVCAAAGVPLRTLQAWMGHESITTTEVYASFMPREQDAAMVSAAFSSKSAAGASKRKRKTTR